MKGSELARQIREAGVRAQDKGDVIRAVQSALGDLAEGEVIVISGSLSFMGDLLREGGFHGYH